MNKTLIYTPDAGRAFWKLAEAVQESCTRTLYLYGLTAQGDVKRMVGRNAPRLRDGEYRIIFEEAATSLTIVEIGHRGQVYRCAEAGGEPSDSGDDLRRGTGGSLAP